MTVQTWDDVKRAALHDPWLRSAVTMVETGLLTREQALITVILAQSECINGMIADEIERLNRTLKQPIVDKVEGQRWNRG